MGYKFKDARLETQTSTLITIRKREYEELLKAKSELTRVMDVERENEILSENMESLLLLKDLSDVTIVDGKVFVEKTAKTSQGKTQQATLWTKLMERFGRKRCS